MNQISDTSSSHSPCPGRSCPENWEPGIIFPTVALLFCVSQVHLVTFWPKTQTEAAAHYRIHAQAELGHFTPGGQLHVTAENQRIFRNTYFIDLCYTIFSCKENKQRRMLVPHSYPWQCLIAKGDTDFRAQSNYPHLLPQ